MKEKIKNFLFIKMCFIFMLQAHAVCMPQSPKDCLNYNQDITRHLESIKSHHNRLGVSTLTPLLKAAHAKIKSFGATLYYNQIELSKAKVPFLFETLIQEYLRQRQEGIPWLPLSFTYNEVHIEKIIPQLMLNLEANLHSLNAKNLFYLAPQLLKITPHLRSKDEIYQLRKISEDLARTYKSFLDIQIEIHQSPNLNTIEKINKWKIDFNINKLDVIAKVNSLIHLLKRLFGGHDLKDVREEYELPSNIKKKFIQIENSLANATATKAELIKAITQINQVSLYLDKLISQITVENCSNDKEINCIYELVGISNALKSTIFSINSKLKSLDQVSISIKDAFTIMINILSIANHHQLINYDNSVLKDLLSRGSLTTNEVLEEMAIIENEITNKAQNINNLFFPLLRIYSPFVPDAAKYTDNIIRESILYPLSLWHHHVTQLLNKKSNINFHHNDKKLPGSFRVLNSSIAKGKIVIPTTDDLKDPDYSWDPNSIYILNKTPASISKVGGILSSHSGSSISHVQLLAKNHGIPNVYISKQLYIELSKLKDKEVYLIVLPTGEIKLIDQHLATTEVKNIYLRFHRLKEKSKVEITTPPNLDKYNYPLKLSQLRYRHLGLIAGGKACGLGELSKLFPRSVPKGIVLPFSVFYNHLKQNGTDAKIKTLLTQNDLSIKSVRSAVLKQIRTHILNLKIEDHIKIWLEKALHQIPFVDSRTGHENGLFIRSDTNAEDLPNFVGAGLNLTVPNITGLDKVLEAIKKTWASPFREKSWSWRADLIKNPWNILTSVIIQVGVDADRAGVMIVGDPSKASDFDNQIQIASNQGLGLSVVDGRYMSEEIQYSRLTDKIKVIRKSFSPTKLVFDVNGGVKTVKTLFKERVMSDYHVLKLVGYGARLQTLMAHNYGLLKKWDIEWGMKNDKVILFQMRPFIGNKWKKDLSLLLNLSETRTSNIKIDWNWNINLKEETL
jgi:pyruvate,water dikinase